MKGEVIWIKRKPGLVKEKLAINENKLRAQINGNLGCSDVQINKHMGYPDCCNRKSGVHFAFLTDRPSNWKCRLIGSDATRSIPSLG
jgi:hypothetical protein